MSTQPTKLGDFQAGGQQSLAHTGELPTKDYPDPAGYERTRPAGRGGIIAWIGHGEIVEVQRVTGPDRTVYELLVTEGGRTSLLAECQSEAVAVEVAGEHMTDGGGRGE